jgi:hypothetical protein
MLPPRENFESSSGLLLMYLANELSPADRARVEEQLALGGTVAAELESLRAANAAYEQAMRMLDAQAPPEVSQPAAAERACDLVREWTEGRLARPAPVKARELLFPWWSYPLAAAAAILIAVTLWAVKHHQWYLDHPESLVTDDSNQQQNEDDPVMHSTPSSAIADLSDEQQQDLLNSFERAAPASGASPAPSGLDEADRNIAAIQSGDDLDDPLLGGESEHREVSP